MKLTSSFFNLLAALAVVTSPLLVSANEENGLEKRAIYSTCSGWGTSTQGAYTIVQNLWGASAGTGSQCLNLNSYSSGVFAWDTTWSWSGGKYNVKSYDNISYNIATGIQVSSISSIPTTWDWSQTSSGTPVCDVAYDLMTTATSSINDNHAYEVMVWLGAFGGAGPISSSGSPVSTPTISGHSWKLFDGYNGSMRVFSFVATSTINSYSGDLMDFLKYLSTHNGFPTSQYLTVLQAGTEPFTGSQVKLTTSKYTVSVKTGGSTTPTTTKGTTTKGTTTTKGSTGGTAPVWGQCGGLGWTGPTACASGSKCTYSNTWYSQCIPS